MKQKPRYITLPEAWDELTEADWRELLKIRQTVATTDHQWTVEDVRIESARMLLQNRSVRTRTHNRQWLLLVSQVAESLTWLWKVEGGGLSLVYRSTVNLIPRIQAGTKKEHQEWLGPLSHGSDLTFGEFRMATAILRQYEQQPDDPRHLQVLAGLLYRPAATDEQKAFTGDRQLLRQPYDWDDFEAKRLRGARMKPWQVWGIYAWIAFFCEYLTTGIFTIGGTNISFAPLFETGRDGKPGSQETAGNSLQQISLTLAETHVFGTARDVDRTPLLTVMQKLLQDYQTLQRLKKRKNS